MTIDDVVYDLLNKEIEITKPSLVCAIGKRTVKPFKNVYINATVKVGMLNVREIFNRRLSKYVYITIGEKIPDFYTVHVRNGITIIHTEGGTCGSSFSPSTWSVIDSAQPGDKRYKDFMLGVDRVKRRIDETDFSFMDKKGKINPRMLGNFNITSPEDIKAVVKIFGMMKSRQKAFSSLRELDRYLLQKKEIDDLDAEQIYNAIVVNSVHKE